MVPMTGVLMMRRYQSVRRALVALAAVLGGVDAWGDGCKFPLAGVRDLPDIPFQRAVVAHRDGVEQLLIESSLDGAGKGFAWVIPGRVPLDIVVLGAIPLVCWI